MLLLFEDLEIDTAAYEVRRAGAIVPTEPLVFDLICYLAQNPHRLINRDEIIETVWSGRFVSDATVTGTIKQARRALGDTGKDQRFIRTIRARGFQFVADVKRMEAEQSSADAGTVGSLNTGLPREKALWQPLARPRPAIAILPFTNLSGDRQDDYFSDGLTEDIITELARFSSLTVVARSSTFAFRDQSIDMTQAANKLGAHFLLEGSVRKNGDRMRLTAQLIDVQSGTQVWAERYEKLEQDIFQVQDELVHDIVSTLPGQIEALQRKQILRRPTESLAAYDLYLRALECERNYDRENLIQGREFLERAVELDPEFARAHGLLAFFTFSAQWFENSDDEGAVDRAIAHGHRAIECDPSDNDCFAQLGTAYLSNCEYDKALINLEQALTMNPHDCWTWSHYSWLLTTLGEHHISLEYMSRREAIDPVPPLWHWETRGISEYSIGRYDAAAATFKRIAHPGFWIQGFLAACYGQLEKPEAAREKWSKMLENHPHVEVPDIFAPNSNTMKEFHDVEHWLDGLRKAGIVD